MGCSQAVVLCGGLGTRLRTVSGGKPKALVDVGGRPFLNILLHFLERRGIRKAVLATGFGHDAVVAQFGNRCGCVDLDYSREIEPLETGGALAQALGRLDAENVFVVNGDTYFDVDLQALHDFHLAHQADTTLALKYLENFDRYGTAELVDDRIVAFHEKRPVEQGLVNGGIYVVRRNVFAGMSWAEAFSFERDYLEPNVETRRLCGLRQEGYFIDIGIPEDYARACVQLPKLDPA